MRTGSRMTTPRPSDAAPNTSTKPPRRPSVTAAFTMSWDGRIIKPRPPRKPTDAVLCEHDSVEQPAPPETTRVLLLPTGRIDPGAGFFHAGPHPVIVYSPARMPRTTQAALAAVPHVRLHLRTAGPWPLREALEHLRATHKVRQLAFAAGPDLFRQLVTEGLLTDLSLAWRPTLLGGQSQSITGPDKHFLPRAIALDLLKLERNPQECIAHYRIHPL